MKSILWIQSETINGNDTFVINGDIISIDEIDRREKAFIYLHETLDTFPSYKKNKLLRFLLKTKHTSNNFDIFISKGKGILIKSVLENLDEQGRLIPLMFYTKENNLSFALNLLKDNLNKKGYTLYNLDDKTLCNFISKISDIKKKGVILITVLLVSIILTLFCFRYNNNNEGYEFKRDSIYINP